MAEIGSEALHLDIVGADHLIMGVQDLVQYLDHVLLVIHQLLGVDTDHDLTLLLLLQDGETITLSPHGEGRLTTQDHRGIMCMNGKVAGIMCMNVKVAMCAEGHTLQITTMQILVKLIMVMPKSLWWMMLKVDLTGDHLEENLAHLPDHGLDRLSCLPGTADSYSTTCWLVV